MPQLRSFGKIGRMVVDTSVIINLNATGVAGPIIRALGTPLVASTIVRNELGSDRINGRNDRDLAAQLETEGLLRFDVLDDPTLEIFETLVSGCAENTLDDGEAATLALALSIDAVACIDERKAIRVARERFPSMALVATVDILSSDLVISALGQEGVTNALLSALKGARMGIPGSHHDWVKEILGNRITECISVPAMLRQD